MVSVTPFACDVIGQLVNRDHCGTVLLRHRHGVGDVVAMAVREQNVVNL